MGARVHVLPFAEQEFHERGGGVRSLPRATPAVGATQFLTGITDIPVGHAIPLHTHSSDEFVLVLQGRATVRWDDGQAQVGALDSTVITRGVPHQFENVGGEVLRILWVYGDPDTTRTLVETGETFGHLDPYPQSG